MKRIVLITVIFVSSWVRAQNSIDLFTLSTFYSPPAKYEAPLDQYGAKATETGTWSNLKIPLKITDKLMWYNDFTHMYYQVNSTVDSPGVAPGNLHAFILQSGVVYKLNEQSGFQLLAVPRNTSDLQNADNKRWQIGGIALYERRMNERLLMRFGVMYNGELFGPLLVPLVFVDWKISEKWRMFGLAPISMRLNYQINERWATGWNHFGLITTYRLGAEPYRTDYIERNSIDENIYARWKMAGNFYLEGRVGYSLSRVYEQYAEDQKMDLRVSILSFGDDRVQKNVSFNSGPIFTMRLVYNVPVP